MDPSSKVTATRALTAASRGDPRASAQLMPLVYDELRALAAAYLRRERPDHTLQPTALVHEAFLRLIDQPYAEYNGRTHFFAVAAAVVRRVLVDSARADKAAKRGGGWHRLTLEQAPESLSPRELDVLALEEALAELAELDERQCRVVELRFFGGLRVEDTAQVLGVSTRTVEEEWRMARAWLRLRLKGEALQ
jgi:RNA polymerase sigma factor (TIGR02999 family)